MTISLVTGGAGFIGSHLVEALAARGDPVRVLDDFRAGRLANLSRLPTRVEVIWGELGDPDLAAAALAGVGRVFPRASWAEPGSPAAPRRFFQAARDAGVRRVVAAVPAAAGDGFDPSAVASDGLDVVWLRYATVLGPRHAPADADGHTL